MPRTYERKFDWTEAKRRRDAGESYTSIARDFGVTPVAIRYAVDEEYREASKACTAEWQRGGTCPDCGTQTTLRAGHTSSRCTRCAHDRIAFTVREDELQCSRCKEWKPDADFYPGQSSRLIARRGRKNECRACDNRQRQLHRERNRERERAYEREYRKRRAAAA